jgi:hypothetical protein
MIVQEKIDRTWKRAQGAHLSHSPLPPDSFKW